MKPANGVQNESTIIHDGELLQLNALLVIPDGLSYPWTGNPRSVLSVIKDKYSPCMH